MTSSQMSSPTIQQHGGRKRWLVEQLISLRTQAGITLHAHVIVLPKEQDRTSRQIVTMMCEIAEKQNWPYLPIVLHTRLNDDGGEIVRKLLAENAETIASIERAVNGSENFHLSIFGMLTGCGNDEQLMALH